MAIISEIPIGSRVPPKPPKPLTRKDARKLVNLKLNPHGFNMKTKGLSNTSLKRVSAELAQHRNRLKLVEYILNKSQATNMIRNLLQDYPHFYTTRNRIRIFVEKLCSAKMPERAQVLLKTKTPLQPMDVPKRRTGLLATTDDDDEENDASERTSVSQEDEDVDEASTTSSKPQRQEQHLNFKAQLEQMLAKPVAQVIAKPKLGQTQQAKPMPLPRKRVMFNTLGSGKSIDTNEE